MSRKWIIDLHFETAENKIIQLNSKLDTDLKYYEIGNAKHLKIDHVGVYLIKKV